MFNLYRCLYFISNVSVNVFTSTFSNQDAFSNKVLKKHSAISEWGFEGISTTRTLLVIIGAQFHHQTPSDVNELITELYLLLLLLFTTLYPKSTTDTLCSTRCAWFDKNLDWHSQVESVQIMVTINMDKLKSERGFFTLNPNFTFFL